MILKKSFCLSLACLVETFGVTFNNHMNWNNYIESTAKTDPGKDNSLYPARPHSSSESISHKTGHKSLGGGPWSFETEGGHNKLP